MGENYYNTIIGYLISNAHISNSDRELYLYAVKNLIRSFINVFVFFILGLVFDMIQESIFMFLSFFVLRKFAGGLHLNKYITCFVSSIVVNVLGLLLIKYLQNYPSYILVVAMIASCLAIIFCAPVEHPNKPISKKEAKTYKIVSIVFSFAICLASTILIVSKTLTKVAVSLETGLIISTILMIAGKINTRINIFKHNV